MFVNFRDCDDLNLILI